MPVECEQIGACTLYLGDCREVLPTLGEVDAIIMDPPYGVELRGKTHPGKFSANSVTMATVRYADSPQEVDALIPPLMAWTLAHSHRAIVLPGHRMLWAYPPSQSMGCIFQSNAAGRDRWGFGGFTPILYYGKCPYGATRPNSFQSWHPGMHVTGEAWIDHPCPKPLSWRLWLVERGSLLAETVCDPVMGSGTTGVACVQLGRAFVGIEIERHFFDIACQRITDAYAQSDLFVPQPTRPTQQALFTGGHA
jgi:site-specific DNA-methyltransferase (adenine-specific)